MEFELVHALDEAQTETLHQLYKKEWWTDRRNLEEVREMLVHTDYIFGCCLKETRELVGFTRVLTDRVYKALVLDLIVAEPYRFKGLARRLMDAVFEHQDLERVKHFELYCLPEMIPFYRKWGFTIETGGIHFMRSVRKTS